MDVCWIEQETRIKVDSVCYHEAESSVEVGTSSWERVEGRAHFFCGVVS